MKGPFNPIEFPIPEKYINLNKYVKELTEAYSKMGEFNAKMQETQIPFTYAINHMLKLESLYSTRIEGTQTTIDAVYEADIDSNKRQNSDIKEVLRYNEALKTASKSVETSSITLKLIKEIHKILLQGDIRKNSDFIAGRFREQQNCVGEHIPPVATDVEKWMSNLERYINDDYGYEDNLPAVIKAALIHAQFETIHPFPDGNGRVGRVLIPIYLYKQKVITSPYFFLSQELEKNSIRYYSYLQGTRTLTEKGFSDWIKFFLQSIINQTDSDIRFIDNINALYTETLQKMKSYITTNNDEVFIKAIFKNPIFTTDTLYNETGIYKNSLRNYISILKNNQIIFSGGQKRNTKYYFMELLDLMK